MTRPIYENEDTLKAEANFAITIVKKMKVIKLHKMPISYGFDYMMTDRGEGRCKGFLEMKCRKMSATDFPDVYLALGKWMKGLEYLDLGFTVIFAVRFLDKDMYYTFKKEDSKIFKIDMSGRTTQTRDKADIEPIIHIPMDRFKS